MSSRMVRAAEAVVDVFARAGEDQVVEFAALMEACEVTSRTALRYVVAAARPAALHRYRYAIVAERGTGYRVARAVEHQALALGKRRSARRALDQGAALLTYTDLSQLSPEEAAAHEHTRRAVVLLAAVAAEHDQRLRRIEEAVFGRPKEGDCPDAAHD